MLAGLSLWLSVCLFLSLFVSLSLCIRVWVCVRVCVCVVGRVIEDLKLFGNTLPTGAIAFKKGEKSLE